MNVMLSQSSSNDDNEVVPSSLPIAHHDDGKEEQNPDDNDAYATAEPFSSDEDNVLITSIHGENQPGKKTSSKQTHKKSVKTASTIV